MKLYVCDLFFYSYVFSTNECYRQGKSATLLFLVFLWDLTAMKKKIAEVFFEDHSKPTRGCGLLDTVCSVADSPEMDEDYVTSS